MFLNDLLKSCVIELCKLCKIVNIGDDVAQVFFQQHEVILCRHIILSQSCASILRRLGASLIQTRNHVVDLFLARFDPSYDLPRFDSLECEDLIKLALQLGNERLLVIFVPLSPLWLGLLLGRFAVERKLESALQIVIGYVIVLIWFEERSLQLPAKTDNEC